MHYRYFLFVLIATLGLALGACQTDQNAAPTEAPAIPTATTEAPTQPAAGEEEYPAPAEQQSPQDSYPAPTEDVGSGSSDTEAYP